MDNEKVFEVPEWVIDNIENTLRIAYNMSYVGDINRETCFDRDVRGCLNCIRKIMDGVELTGHERLETLYNRKNK